MNRRKFIYNSLLTTTAVTGASLLNNCSTGIELKKVTILHTNDVHSHIDQLTPFYFLLLNTQ